MESLNQTGNVSAMTKIPAATRPTQTVERALSLLDVLAESTRPMNLKEISQRSQLNATTCLRLLRTLELNHYVVRLPESGQYRLGGKILTLAYAMESQLDIRTIARPVLQELSLAIGESAGLIIRQGNEGIVIERAAGPSALRHVTGIGYRGPLYCTSAGKVLLAWSEPEWRERYLANEILHQLTPTTITSRSALEVQLEQIRESGYATDYGEREEGLVAIAAPVRDAADHVVASIGVSGPAERMPDELMPEFIRRLVLGAEEISIQLGWSPVTSREPVGLRS